MISGDANGAGLGCQSLKSGVASRAQGNLPAPRYFRERHDLRPSGTALAFCPSRKFMLRDALWHFVRRQCRLVSALPARHLDVRCIGREQGGQVVDHRWHILRCRGSVQHPAAVRSPTVLRLV